MDNIPVIQHKHRFSLGLDVTDHEIVRTALSELASFIENQLLTTVLDQLLGVNPAVVELSTITCEIGAAAQYFHSDSTVAGSAAVFSRSFTEACTILIPLQDTVKQQGATWVCPGTHRCARVAQSACQDVGFQVVTANVSTTSDDDNGNNNDSSYFRAGDALVYSSSATHRGGAHLIGPDRVVLIVIVVRRPGPVRLLPLGPVYGIRWDHWGLCWQDLAKLADSTVWTIPFWHKIRALGLWKVSGDWGWTYLESSALRMMNDMFYFSFTDLRSFRNA